MVLCESFCFVFVDVSEAELCRYMSDPFCSRRPWKNPSEAGAGSFVGDIAQASSDALRRKLFEALRQQFECSDL